MAHLHVNQELGDRRLEKGMKCLLVTGCLTGPGTLLQMWLRHPVWDGV